MSDENAQSPGRMLFFYAATAAFTLLLLEVGFFVLLHLVDRDDYFDHRESVFGNFSADSFAWFLEHSADPVLGWSNSGPRQKREANCQGEEILYRYDARGARIHAFYDPDDVQILAVGDSYTHGNEVGADENYVAQLGKLTGLSVVNHGVGGYGPTQSLLNLEQKLQLYPGTQITLLGIMYENLMRMVNSYRPVLYATSSDYTLKPYVAGSEVRPHPGTAAFTSLEAFREHAGHAFDTDFWAKPDLSFPYTVSLVRALSSNYFVLRRVQKTFREAGLPEYFLTVRNEDIRTALLTLLNRYGEWGAANGVQPVVVFIPRNDLDLQSLTRFLEEYGEELHPALVVGDMAAMQDVDWPAFNLRAEEDGDVNICHPSPYGYNRIAAYIAGLLREKNLP